MSMDADTAVTAIVAELRRQAHDYKRSKQPPFVGPSDTTNAVFVHGHVDLEALARAVTSSTDRQGALA